MNRQDAKIAKTKQKKNIDERKSANANQSLPFSFSLLFLAFLATWRLFSGRLAASWAWWTGPAAAARPGHHAGTGAFAG
jgi:hypothetical protein